jgi:hypothetical protein
VGRKCALNLKIIHLELHFPHYESAAFNVSHFQWHSIPFFFRVTLRNGFGDMALRAKVVGRETPENEEIEINFVYFSLGAVPSGRAV